VELDVYFAHVLVWKPKVYCYVSCYNLFFIIRVLLPTTKPTRYPEDEVGIFLRNIDMT
jgi:hypothetical protein